MKFERIEFTPPPSSIEREPVTMTGHRTPSGRWIVVQVRRQGWGVMHRSGFSILPPFQWSLDRAKKVAEAAEGCQTPRMDAIDSPSRTGAAQRARRCLDELALIRAAAVALGVEL